MTLHQLRIFESVARHLNISRASEELHMSQPAVSQQLRLLEEEYRVKFLLRVSQGVALSDEGLAFLDAIRPLLVQAESIERKFKKNLDAKGSGLLVVGGSPGVSVTILLEIVTAFKKARPEVDIRFESNHSRIMEQRILNSEVEVALITNASCAPDIIYESYTEQEVVAFTRAESPLAVKQRMTLSELAQVPLVVRDQGRILKELARRGYKCNIVMRCETSEAVKAAVQRGMGVGILRSLSVEHGIARGVLKRIDVPELEKIKVKSFIVYRRGKPLSPMAQDFLKLLRQRNTPRVQRNERKVTIRSQRFLH